MSNEKPKNIIRASVPEPVEHAILENPAPKKTRIKEIQGQNADVAQEIANLLNDQNQVPQDMRPKGYAKEVEAQVGPTQQQEHQGNVIRPTAQNESDKQSTAPKVFTGTTSAKIRGAQTTNVIKAGNPGPQQLVQESQQTVQPPSKIPVVKPGAIRTKNRIMDVTPKSDPPPPPIERVVNQHVTPQQAETGEVGRAELETHPQSDYMYINKAARPVRARQPVGLLQNMLHNLLNSDNPANVFETIKDDGQALAEIKKNQAVFTDTKHMGYIMTEYNKYKGNRAWQRLRTR